MQQNQVRSIVYTLQQNIRRVIVGKDEAIELALIALLCKGHVLIEDVPGVGKTTLVAALARSLSCSFKRIQFTPDVTPSDITGFTMPSLQTGEMEYKSGAVMSQIVLADEINRTSPRTQSSLLEVMEEGQVTVDGVTHPLPRPFMVLATQNPVDFVGTYPLPEAQMDRFFLRITIGYPSIEEEMDVLERYSGQASPLSSLQSVCGAGDVVAMQELVGGHIEVIDYQGACLICNEDGKLLGLEPNRRIGQDVIVGTFFLANSDLEGRMFSLSEEDLALFQQQFAQPEALTQKDVQNAFGFKFYSM